jgi:hypothetical protein
MTAIRLISDAWIAKQREILAITAPGEGRDRLALEIAEAEKHLKAKNEVVAAAAKLGYRRNERDGKCARTGAEVKAFKGFCRKEPAGWRVYSWEAVQAEVGHPGVE